MQPNDITHYLKTIESDRRLNVWNIAILIAILAMALKQGPSSGIRVSRSKLWPNPIVKPCLPITGTLKNYMFYDIYATGHHIILV